MGLVWNPWSLTGFLAMALAFAMAAFVYFAAPGGQHANRRLSLILLLEGCAIGAGNGLIYAVDQPNLAQAAQAVSVTAVLLLPATYLLFIATVDSPLSRFWNHPFGLVAIVAIAVGSVATFFLNPTAFIPSLYPQPWYHPRGFDADLGSAYQLFGWFRLGVLLYCFLVAIDAVQRSTSAIAKRRAKAFAIAFGLWDAAKLITSFLFLVVVPRMSESGAITTTGIKAVDLVGVIYYPLTLFFFAPLLALGILRTQLFDIDVKIRFTISKGALASGALLIFFMTTQLIEMKFQNDFGWVGGMLAGGLFFLLSPIQKMTERLAEKVMPGAKGVGDLTTKERNRLYQEQLEFAFSDGNVSKKERMLLEHLRARLGVERPEAQKLEKQFLASFGAVRRRASPA